MMENDGSINNYPEHQENSSIFLQDILAGNTKAVVHHINTQTQNINVINKKGQNGLHICAVKGYLEICGILIENGIDLFAYDAQGNTAYHIAVIYNQIHILRYLYDNGLRLAKTIKVSDVKIGNILHTTNTSVIADNREATFNELCEHIFDYLPTVKLTTIDTPRFEKSWLIDAYTTLKNLLNNLYYRRIPPANIDIINYTLRIFDPRPENGVFIANTVYNPLKENDLYRFIPVIASAIDLIHLLYHAIRLHLLDVINSLWNRTPLHTACDCNIIESHAEIIYFLINDCGCNVYLKDKNNRTPIELLSQDNHILFDKPSASQLNEDLLSSRREEYFELKQKEQLFNKQFQKDKFHDEIIQDCRQLAYSESMLTWGAYFNSAIRQRTYTHWIKCIDPETRNIFYAFSESNLNLPGEKDFTRFSWKLPTEASEVEVVDSIAYWASVHCSFLRSLGDWNMLYDRVNMTNIYIHRSTLAIQFQPPHEMNLMNYLHQSKQIEVLGFYQEWKVLQMADGNVFYYNMLQNIINWDRPPDAIATGLREQLCLASYTDKNIEHRMFTCDTCRLKNKSSDKVAALRLCEPCAMRCHRNHKGVRFLRTGFGRCGCESCGVSIGSPCISQNPSKQQQKCQNQRAAIDNERRRRELYDALFPPIIAYCPQTDTRGSTLVESGWMVCRCASTAESLSAARTYCEENKMEMPLYLSSIYDSYKSREEKDGWVAVFSYNRFGSLAIGELVLCLKGNPENEYGRIIEYISKYNLYKVQLISGIMYVLPRDQLHKLNSEIFYFNPILSISVWDFTVFDENSMKCFVERSVNQLGGNAWMRIQQQAVLRRCFKDYDEYIDIYSSKLFYVHFDINNQETSARIIQNFVRQKFNWLLPLVWVSSAYSFAKPNAVVDEEMQLGAWSYLRRRSKCNGRFFDDLKEDWEEYIDSKSAEYFYWNEKRTQYQWIKPKTPETKDYSIDILDIGDAVLYRFTQDEAEEECAVTKRRSDDSTGQDMYDVQHKYDKDKVATWVPRIALKRIPLALEEASFKKLESFWVNQIRRQRAAEERKIVKKSIGKTFIDISALDFRATDKTLDAEEIQRRSETREYLAIQEELEVRSHEDKRKADDRAVLVNDAITIATNDADSSAEILNRSEIVRIQRATDLMIRIQDKVESSRMDRFANEQIRLKRLHDQRKEEDEMRDMEAGLSTPRSLRRRKIIRELHRAMRRHTAGYFICDSGCREWIEGLDSLEEHFQKKCLLREVFCSLECGLHMTEDMWLMNDRQFNHEISECPNRLVYCPLQCLEWVIAKELEFHVSELCPKRPGKCLTCRLGCGKIFGGTIEQQLDAEEERYSHEAEDCDLRLVRCSWRYGEGKICGAMIVAKDRNLHRDEHIVLTGVITHRTAGTFVYKVPDKITYLKIQVWGAGGGSGCFLERRAGSGGGGAFVEVILNVHPRETLECCVGEGGRAGEYGLATIDEPSSDIVTHGEAEGGIPGGGIGFGGNAFFACGGGGGYSMVSRRTVQGPELLIIAGGGGGGGSIDGMAAVGIHGILPGTKYDRLNGMQGGTISGGVSGDAGGALTAKWPGTAGVAYQGGDGCEFGAGGGGGLFGGGGGGTTPGIAGGGGGGSSWINAKYFRDFVSIGGNGYLPGGITHDIPEAVGVGDWDKLGGVVGEGGHTENTKKTCNGNNGAIRIIKPGFY